MAEMAKLVPSPKPWPREWCVLPEPDAQAWQHSCPDGNDGHEAGCHKKGAEAPPAVPGPLQIVQRLGAEVL